MNPAPIAVVTHPEPDLSAPYFVEALAGLRAVFDKLTVNPPAPSSVTGIVFLAPVRGEPWLARAVSAGFPAVVVNASTPDFPSIDVDNVDAARRAVAHLIDRGHRRIGLINGRLHTANGRDRRAGYRRALEEAGLPLDPVLEAEGNFDHAQGRRAMEAFLRLADRPTAVFAANDHMALGAWAALRASGLDAPRSVALVGFDDMPEAEREGLTSVRQPLEEMARQAAEWLRDWLHAGRAPARETVRVEGRLVVRQSS